MGIPLYGYDWKIPYVQGTMAQSLSPQQALEIASIYNAQILFDEQYKAPYFYYTSQGQDHIVWFENAKSAEAKYNIIKNYSLAGTGYWNVDRFFPQNLLLVNSLFKIIKFS